jgi:hypothetical protein
VPQETGETLAYRLADWPSRGCRVEVAFGPSLEGDEDLLEWAQWAVWLAQGESSYTGRSSPHWYDSEGWYELLQAAKDRTVRQVIAELQGCSEPKAGRIAAAFKDRLARSLSRAEADRLLVLARVMAREVKPAALGRLGPLPGLSAGRARASGVCVLGSARSRITAHIPFAVEAWADVAEEDTEATVFVNRSPITGELRAWMNKKRGLCLYGCGLALEIRAGRKPIDLHLNIDTPYMPLTTDGKAPDLHPFAGEIEEAIAKAVRIARRKSPGGGSAETKKAVILANLDAGIAQASGDGQFRFGQRQVFYVVRPLFLAALGELPNWKYFTKVITDYENEHGEIPGMTRDPRGVIYHPHTGEEIPLGTLYVEDYRRPEWLFHKVLYCEKEGFFPILKQIRWAEQHDCALMTSKGFSTRAARDLIDFLAATGEECQFFCIHDADAQGTMIYQTLQLATKARGARKVKIINLGLEPAEARGMGLPSEPVQKKKKTKLAVARYVPRRDRDWLQSSRIELNAMTTPQFLEWLARKFAPFDKGKLIPPDETLRKRLEAEVRWEYERRITARVLRKARVAERVARAMAKRAGRIDAECAALAGRIRDDLKGDPTRRWTEPVKRIARELLSPRPADAG